MEHHELKKRFEEAYTELADALFRYLFFRLGDRERAKELVQETFMKAWTYAAKGNHIKEMRPFLYTIAMNLFRNEIRGKRPVVSLDQLMEENSFEPSEEKPKQEDISDGNRLLAQLDELIPAYKEILTLRYVDGLPVKDIARILNENTITTSVRIHRALKRLRKIYEEKTGT